MALLIFFKAKMNPLCLCTTLLTVPNLPSPSFLTMIKSDNFTVLLISLLTESSLVEVNLGLLASILIYEVSTL